MGLDRAPAFRSAVSPLPLFLRPLLLNSDDRLPSGLLLRWSVGGRGHDK